MDEKIKETQIKYNQVTEAMGKPDADFIALAKQHKKLSAILDKHEKLLSAQSDYEAARELEMQDEAESSQVLVNQLTEELAELLTPRDPRDELNVIMEIRPAAGGDEAAIFTQDLIKMYTSYALANGFGVEFIDDTSFTINGDGAYSKFKYESGVHRVQRIPETETQGRIHTSTCTVAVLPEAVQVDFKIEDKDIRVDVYRASGAGGQHVNKTESAVRITHLPSGMVVTCQDGRSQIKNREKAMTVLQSKLADHYQTMEDQKYAADRKIQVGTGDRSERIRTYNYPQDRITDHRIGFSVHSLPNFMAGDISAMIIALQNANKK